MSKNKKPNDADQSLEKALVFDIQRFSLHDGPGLRTIVFFKGCPLSCLWCDNPESQLNIPELAYFINLCEKCGRCVKSCKHGAIAIKSKQIVIDREKCDGCSICTQECYNGALKILGNYMTVEEVMDEVIKDMPFYKNSNGGVTLSGGEPLQQYNFIAPLLKELKRQEIHTAVETSGFFSLERIQCCLDDIDLFLFDIKQMDSNRHKEVTGVSNELILENAKKLAAMGKKITIRVPYIPDINDSMLNMKMLGNFLHELNIHSINLLPYHKLGLSKYEALGRRYLADFINEPDKEELKNAQQFFTSILNEEVMIG